MERLAEHAVKLKTAKQLPLSYVSGPSQVPLRYETIGQALDRTVDAHGDAEAIVVVHQDVRWTWRALQERVDRLASAFLGLGLERGDRVAIWSPNCAEWVLVQLATARIGVILVTINPAYRASELHYALELVGCRALVLAERFKTSDYVAMLLEIAPEFADVSQSGSPRGPGDLEYVIQIGGAARANFIALDELLGTPLDEAGLQARQATIQPEDPINIQFTSGTTGSPKGATLTHHNILNNALFVGDRMGLGRDDRVCIPVPLYHCFGMVMGVLNCLVRGAAMIFPGEAFEPGGVLQAIATEKCTALYGVPAMFIAELSYENRAMFDLSSLRTGIMAGAPCPSDVMRRVIADMHMTDVTICYGMTETSPVSFQTLSDAAFDTRVDTVGSVHPHVEAKLVDASGHVVPMGEVGEILVRGYGVMSGYWNDPERTAQVVDPAGWMHTGDLGMLDEQGRCRIVGRSKDMIIRGGENIYPAEIENFLFRHPQVVEAAVFGIPCDRYGEQVCAWLRVKEETTAEDVISFCEGQIAHYKIPRVIRFVESFPVTATGKLQKFVMQERMRMEGFG